MLTDDTQGPKTARAVPLQPRAACRYADLAQAIGSKRGPMRISRRNFRLGSLCGALLLAGSWGACSAQGVTPPPMPGQNPMHVYLHTGLNTHGAGEASAAMT